MLDEGVEPYGIWHDDVTMAMLDREYAEIQRNKA
jgi:hypothetical protein